MKIGIVAASSKVSMTELQLGVEKLEAAGFDVKVHPQAKKLHRFFAGTDEERAGAFHEFARDPSIEAIWCARGGYGAARLVPLLEKLSAEKGAPPAKLLVGCSDVTVLSEYTRTRWNWTTLHAPMPGLRKFSLLKDSEWDPLVRLVRGERPRKNPWPKKLRHVKGSPVLSKPLEAEIVVGGNLTVWASMLGTKYAPSARGRIVFFEDVDEALYRLDRVLNQAYESGSLDGVKAIVLGNFLNCRDPVAQVLAKVPAPGKRRARVLSAPKPSELAPIRKRLDEKRAIPEIFAEVGRKLGAPVYSGLPVGHGPELSPLPLGASYRLAPNGAFELLNWDWLR